MVSVVSLNSNMAALRVQRHLDQTTRSQERVLERLSSGLRINHAADDAAGLAISESLNLDSKVFTQGIRNLNDGISLFNIADGALSELQNITSRIIELAEQAASGTYQAQQRAALDLEAQQLSKEYTRITQSTQFNGMRLLNGTFEEVRLQAGYGVEGSLAGTVGGAIGTGAFSVSFTSTLVGATLPVEVIALADLNSDGILDSVTTGSDGTFVLVGNGDGSFAVGASYFDTTERDALVLSDVNNDGIVDLLTAGSDISGGRATVRLGVGDGTFGTATSSITTSYATWAMTVGDLNGDGFLDLVTAGEDDFLGDGHAVVQLGKGDGTFGATRSYLTETRVSYDVELGDLNGDGVLDLITTGYDDAGSGSTTVRLGVGDGTFSTARSYLFAASGGTSGIALADLNTDGFLDLVIAGHELNDGYASVRLGIGNGTFGTATSFATETRRSEAIAVGDLNGDGILDLVTAGRADFPADGYATIHFGVGNGTFATAASYATEGRMSRSVKLGDINGDGVLDLMTAGYADSVAGYTTARLGKTRAGVAPLLPFSLTTQADAKWALSLMQQKLRQNSQQRATIGAFQSRLETATANLSSTVENLAAARGRIRDADVAEESAHLVRLQILQNVNAAVLGQANQAPALALQILERS